MRFLLKFPYQCIFFFLFFETLFFNVTRSELVVRRARLIVACFLQKRYWGFRGRRRYQVLARKTEVSLAASQVKKRRREEEKPSAHVVAVVMTMMLLMMIMMRW